MVSMSYFSLGDSSLFVMFLLHIFNLTARVKHEKVIRVYVWWIYAD